MRERLGDKEAETAVLEACRETAVLVAKKLTAARTPEAKNIPKERVCFSVSVQVSCSFRFAFKSPPGTFFSK